MARHGHFAQFFFFKESLHTRTAGMTGQKSTTRSSPRYARSPHLWWKLPRSPHCTDIALPSKATEPRSTHFQLLAISLLFLFGPPQSLCQGFNWILGNGASTIPFSPALCFWPRFGLPKSQVSNPLFFCFSHRPQGSRFLVFIRLSDTDGFVHCHMLYKHGIPLWTLDRLKDCLADGVPIFFG